VGFYEAVLALGVQWRRDRNRVRVVVCRAFAENPVQSSVVVFSIDAKAPRVVKRCTENECSVDRGKVNLSRSD
jgi:hypothetical protein